MHINRFFPSIIATNVNPKHIDYENVLVEKCLQISKDIESGGENWISQNTYNTLNTYDISQVKEFKEVNKFVIDSVKEFCNEMRMNYDRVNKLPSDSWFNIYEKGDYQEYHNHAGNLISAVYYLKTPKNCSKLFFKNPANDMFLPEYTEDIMDNFQFGYIVPKAGMVVIFRSYLEHCVEQEKNNDTRISLAYNFTKK